MNDVVGSIIVVWMLVALFGLLSWLAAMSDATHTGENGNWISLLHVVVVLLLGGGLTVLLVTGVMPAFTHH